MDEYKKEQIIRNLIIIVAFIIQVLSISVYMLDSIKYRNDISVVMLLLMGITFFLLDYFVFYKNFRELSLNKLRERCELMECQKKMQEKYDRDIVKYERESKEIKEELLNKISEMRKQIDIKEEEGIDGSVTEFMQILDKTRNIYFCENMLVNLILTEKKKTAEEQGITFDAAVTLPGQIEVESVDISSVLGNLLDNAIEACVRVEDPDRRKISVKSILKDECWVIKVDNTFNQDDLSVEEHTYRTTKQNKSNHGFGINIIRDIARKYNGELQIHIENGHFIVVVYMDCSEGE